MREAAAAALAERTRCWLAQQSAIIRGGGA